MNKRIKLLILFIFFSILSSHSIAGDAYVIKSGDTLSDIVAKFIKSPPQLYGANGRISKVLALNPHITNPNVITVGSIINLPNLKIKLPKKTKSKVAINKNTWQRKKKTRKESKVIKDAFEFGMGYGTNYSSYAQSGTLGSASLGVLFINSLNFFTSYKIGNFKLEGESQSSTFEYSFNNSTSKINLRNYALRLSYAYFLLGILLEQKPVFKNNTSSIESVPETFLLPTIGITKDFSLNTKIETHLLIQLSIDFVSNSSSNESNIEITKHEGLGSTLKTNISRRLNPNSSFPIFYFWTNDFTYRDIERNIDWGLSVGNVKSQIIHFNSIIGLKAQF